MLARIKLFLVRLFVRIVRRNTPRLTNGDPTVIRVEPIYHIKVEC